MQQESFKKNMYQTTQNPPSSESDNSLDDFAVKEDSDEETGAWITEVTEWHNKLASNNLDDSSDSDIEVGVKKPHPILSPPKLLFEHSHNFDMTEIGNDPQYLIKQNASGIKRKFDEVEMLSDEDETEEFNKLEDLFEEAALPPAAKSVPADHMESYPKDEEERDGEVLVLKVDCLLYVFSNLSSTWVQKAAGKLSVFDYDGEALGIQSRVVVRSHRTMRILLSSKIWSGMSIEKRSQRSLCITALDTFGQAKVFLLSVTIEHLDELYSILRERIDKITRDMSMNYLTRYEHYATAAKRRALDRRNGGGGGDADDYIDPAELD